MGGLGSCVGEGVGVRRAVGASPPPCHCAPCFIVLSGAHFLVPSATSSQCRAKLRNLGGGWVVGEGVGPGAHQRQYVCISLNRSLLFAYSCPAQMSYPRAGPVEVSNSLAVCLRVLTLEPTQTMTSRPTHPSHPLLSWTLCLWSAMSCVCTSAHMGLRAYASLREEREKVWGMPPPPAFPNICSHRPRAHASFGG